MNSYEVVYSAALERQGLCMSLSQVAGPSSLVAFDALDTLAHGDARELTRALRNYDPQFWGANKRRHGFRSKRST